MKQFTISLKEQLEKENQTVNMVDVRNGDYILIIGSSQYEETSLYISKNGIEIITHDHRKEYKYWWNNTLPIKDIVKDILDIHKRKRIWN